MALGATHRLVYFDTADSNKVDPVTRIDADQVLVTDAGGYFAGTEVETALQNVGSAIQSIVLTASQFASSSAAPTQAQSPANRNNAWLFDAATGERVQAMTYIPPTWATTNVSIVWANAGAGAGDVAWRFLYDDVAEGTDLNVIWVGSASPTDTAGAQWIAQLATSSGVAIPTGLVSIAVDRNASAGADTLPNDAAFYALVLTRAS